MSTVYVIQETKHNLSPAKEYGNLIVMCSYPDVEKGSLHLVHHMRSIFCKHNLSREDYILCVGDPIAIGIAVSLALRMSQGIIQALRWDKHTYSYEEVTINIER